MTGAKSWGPLQPLLAACVAPARSGADNSYAPGGTDVILQDSPITPVQLLLTVSRRSDTDGMCNVSPPATHSYGPSRHQRLQADPHYEFREGLGKSS